MSIKEKKIISQYNGKNYKLKVRTVDESGQVSEKFAGYSPVAIDKVVFPKAQKAEKPKVEKPKVEAPKVEPVVESVDEKESDLENIL